MQFDEVVTGRRSIRGFKPDPVPQDLVRAVECLTQNLFISAPTLSQIAGVAAFDCGAELDRNVARYAANRQVLLEGLPKLGIDRLAPADGAFYIYADISHLTDDSVGFCRRLLNETGIAATRQLAKRQLTWLRSMPDRRVVACDAADALPQALILLRGLSRV